MHYGTYVKYSLEGILASLAEEEPNAKERRAKLIVEERTKILANYDTFVEIAFSLPPFDAALYEFLFPKVSKKGEVYLGAKPKGPAEMLQLLELFEPAPLAHREREAKVTIWNEESETYRIFPYLFFAQMKPNVMCRMGWCYRYRQDQYIWVRMQLPKEITKAAIDEETGTLRDGLFLEGVMPYVVNANGEYGKVVRLNFPKAYKRNGEAPVRPLGWRDIPLLRDLESRLQAPPISTQGQSTIAVLPPDAPLL